LRETLTCPVGVSLVDDAQSARENVAVLGDGSLFDVRERRKRAVCELGELGPRESDPPTFAAQVQTGAGDIRSSCHAQGTGPK
jgi:hypothetical protein